MMNMHEVLAENVQKLMEHNGIQSKRELARRCSGASHGTVDRVLNFKQNPTLNVLIAISDALNVQLWQLFIQNLDPANLPCKISTSDREYFEKLEQVVASKPSAKG